MRKAVCLMLVMAALAPVARAEPSPVRVTTDTSEYCDTLTRRLSALPQASQEPARSLAQDGLRLCHNGHVRTGVAKLRRALRAALGPATTQTSHAE